MMEFAPRIKKGQRAVSLYPLFVFFLHCHFWLPVFFLFFSSYVTVPQVILLEAIYYVAISLIEVPSGYISDRCNRRFILALAVCFMLCGALVFYFGVTLQTFVIGQISWAAGFAFLSGTDTAFHYESLKKHGREYEYSKRESLAAGMTLLGGALSACIGGIVGIYSLKMVYLFSCSTLCCALVCLWVMEDSGSREVDPRQLGFKVQVTLLIHKALSKELRLLFLFSVFITILVHIPYEMYQPYIQNVSTSLEYSDSMGTGLHLTITMLIGAWFTRYISPLTERYGAMVLLFFMVLLLVFLIFLMTLSYSMVIVCLLLLRTIPKAVSAPLINSLVAPRLLDHQRSTYLSLQSLCGRLCFGVVLLVMTMISAQYPDPVKSALVTGSIIGFVLALWLFAEMKYRREAGKRA